MTAIATLPIAPPTTGIKLAHPARWWLYLLLGCAALVPAVGIELRVRHHAVVSPYITSVASRGDVVETVEATGNLQAVLSIQVGSQVSGRIQTFHVDFSSRVHTGDLLADIDPTPFNAAVAQARGGV